jgi:hypothetical protein
MSDRPSPITHVAIRFHGVIYSLPEPNRHHDVIRLIAERTGVTSVDVRDDDQGFLDTSGTYLRRMPALNRAIATGQMANPTRWPGGLYSENLW